MPKRLMISVKTPDCSDDEVWRHDFPEDTNRQDVLTSIETIYPDWVEFTFYFAEEDEEE